jgi:hypothetical protein
MAVDEKHDVFMVKSISSKRSAESLGFRNFKNSTAATSFKIQWNDSKKKILKIIARSPKLGDSAPVGL